MSQDYHTPYVDGSTQFKADHMNVPLGELDAQIGTNATNIAGNTANIATNTSDLKKTIHVLDTVEVDFSSTGETALHTTVSGEITVLFAAVVRGGGDAGATEVTIGQSGEVTDFLNTQTLSNLDAFGDIAILQPVPSATPACLKFYYGETEIRMRVNTADGNATNWVDLLGYTI